MGRLNRRWIGVFLIVLGRRILPASVRDEWELQFKRKSVDLHDFDTRKFDT